MFQIQGVRDWAIVGAASAQIVSWRVCALGPQEEGYYSHA